MKHILLLITGAFIFSFTIIAQTPLFIPPALYGPTYNLEMKNGSYSFSPGRITPTKGYNGNILGPTLFMNAGTRVQINLLNSIGEQTTTHWHGLHVAPENDGGPHSIIDPNETYQPIFTVLNRAATFWYHPHFHGETDIQVSQGLAGLIVIHDSIEQSYNLPRTYGVDDIPLIVQTKCTDPSADTIQQFTYSDTILIVNATRNPVLNVPQQMVRFRLLNASSHRVFRFGLSNGNTFYQIGTDDGLLASAGAINRLTLAPGERAEILVNFGAYAVGTSTVALYSYASELPIGVFGSINWYKTSSPPSPDYALNPMNGTNFSVLKFNVTSPTTIPTPVTSTNFTATYQPLVIPSTSSVTNTRTRYFFFANMSPNVSGQPYVAYDQNVINDTVALNATEEWTLHGDLTTGHYFHIHDISFFILERRDSSGNLITAVPNDQGGKDVVFVPPSQTVKFITKFQDFTSDVPYVYHCHVLEHEDEGMMYAFLVQNNIYVDKNYTGTHTGSFAQPFQTFQAALGVAVNGSTIVFKSAGSHVDPGVVTIQNKRIRIKLTNNGSSTSPITLQ